MKKQFYILFGIMFAVAMCAAYGWADAVSTFSGATVVPAETATDPFHQILNAIVPLILTGLAALVAWATSNIQTWIKQTASKANTTESAAWYATALSLAGIAVKAAETKFGAETGKGQEKVEDATQWLKARLLTIDPKMKIRDEDLKGFVDAAYHDIFKAVSPLAKHPA